MYGLTHRIIPVVAGVALAASSLSAQARPTFGVSGGLAAPIGDFGDGYESGYDIAAHVGFRPAISPVGFRIEGAYNQFDAKSSSNLKSKIFDVTGNVVIGSPGAPGSVRPYVIAGLGLYNAKTEVRSGSVTSSVSDTKFGVNGGAGLDLPLSGIGVFIEARLHYVFNDEGRGYNASFIPVVVGLRF